MIAVNNERQITKPTGKAASSAMLPEIQQRLRRSISPSGSRVSRGSHRRGRRALLARRLLGCMTKVERRQQLPSTLAWYAALAVKRGRPAWQPHERQGAVEPVRTDRQRNPSRAGHGNWMELLVEDKRASVPDQVAAKMDVGAWFATLTQSHETDRPRFGVSAFRRARSRRSTASRPGGLRSCGGRWKSRGRRSSRKHLPRSPDEGATLAG